MEPMQGPLPASAFDVPASLLARTTEAMEGLRVLPHEVAVDVETGTLFMLCSCWFGM